MFKHISKHFLVKVSDMCAHTLVRVVPAQLAALVAVVVRSLPCPPDALPE